MPTLVKLQILSAKGLRNPWFIRQPHPMAVVFLDTKVVGKTPAVPETCNPDWSKRNQPDPIKVSQKNRLSIKVFDGLQYKKKSSATVRGYLGQAIINGADAIGHAYFGDGVPMILPLYDNDVNEVGTITICVLPPDARSDDEPPSVAGVMDTRDRLEGSIKAFVARFTDSLQDAGNLEGANIQLLINMVNDLKTLVDLYVGAANNIEANLYP